MPAGDRREPVRRLYASGPTYDHYVNMPLGLEPAERVFFAEYCRDKDSRICDIGCGNGREAIGLYDAGYRRVWPVDLNSTMLAVARRNAAARGLQLPFVQASADALPFPERFFDAAIMTCNTYGHITPRAARLQTMREIARVLKPGGLFFVTATSRQHRLRIRAALWLLDIWRLIHNPRGAESGDRLMSRRDSPSTGDRLLIHWFYSGEPAWEGRQAGLEEICSSTAGEFARNPHADARSYHRRGWLACVLRRPA